MKKQQNRKSLRTVFFLCPCCVQIYLCSYILLCCLSSPWRLSISTYSTNGKKGAHFLHKHMKIASRKIKNSWLYAQHICGGEQVQTCAKASERLYRKEYTKYVGLSMKTLAYVVSWKKERVNHTVIRAAFVCVLVPCLLRGPLTDLRQTWWVYVGGPPICPWGVLFRKGQRVDGSTGHFPLYYICASLTPHSCKRPLLLCCSSLIRRLLLHCISTVYVGGPRNCPWGVLFLKGQRVDGSTGQTGQTGHISMV